MAAKSEHRKALQRAWYARNKDRICLAWKARYDSDPEFRAKCLAASQVRPKEKQDQYRRTWAERNPEKRRRIILRANYKKTDALKLAVTNVLTNGEGTCRWCGQGDQDVLTVDHIDHKGSSHRRSIGQSSLYRWLVKNDYPEGFQVLCYNCNVKKERIRRRAERELNV